jgi:hypothetical protein
VALSFLSLVDPCEHRTDDLSFPALSACNIQHYQHDNKSCIPICCVSSTPPLAFAGGACMVPCCMCASVQAPAVNASVGCSETWHPTHYLRIAFVKLLVRLHAALAICNPKRSCIADGRNQLTWALALFRVIFVAAVGRITRRWRFSGICG